MAQYCAAVRALAYMANGKAAELAAPKLGPRKDPVLGYDLEKHVGLLVLNQSVTNRHLTVTKMADCTRWQRLNLMVPNISYQPAHLLNAERAICDGWFFCSFFRRHPISGNILSYVIISGLTPHSGNL